MTHTVTSMTPTNSCPSHVLFACFRLIVEFRCCIIKPWNSFMFVNYVRGDFCLPSFQLSSSQLFHVVSWCVSCTLLSCAISSVCAGLFTAAASSPLFDLCVLECWLLLRLLHCSISVSWNVHCCSVFSVVRFLCPGVLPAAPFSFFPFAASSDFASLLLGPSFIYFLFFFELISQSFPTAMWYPRPLLIRVLLKVLIYIVSL